MAPTLRDFNKGSTTKELRMNAFQPAKQPSPSANPATINTVASYGAAMAPDGNIDATYSSISTQLSYSTSSSTLDAILRKWDERSQAEDLEVMKDVLIDPAYTDEQKQGAITNFQNIPKNTSIAGRVATAAAISDSPGENGEQEEIRVKLATAYNEVDQYNAWVQKSINSLNNDNNPGWGEKVTSFITSIIPFADAADQAFFEGLVDVEGTGGALNTTQTLLALGEGKERLRDTLERLPREERRPVVEKIVAAIKANTGSLGNNTSAMRQIQMMEQMLTPGGYDNTDRWVDNIFSVLDDTILLSPLAKVAGGAKALGRAVKGSEAAAETIARGERAAAAEAGGVIDSAPEQLLIEYKPSPTSYGDDINNVVDNLPGEPNSAQINELREAVMNEIGNPDGFSIDNVIDQITFTDNLNTTEINTLRQNLSTIRDKRVKDLNTVVPKPDPSFVEAQKAHISSNVQPTSISQVYKDTNPSKADIAHKALSQDTTGNAARILYGTDRNSAIGNDLLPEIGGEGRLRSKQEFDEALPQPDKQIIENVKEADGAIWASDAEKAATQSQATRDWKNVVGLSNRSAMASLADLKPSIEGKSSGILFNQVFGPKQGGFTNAIHGVDTVKAALRKYGISDDEITVLARQKDGTYAPAVPKQDLKNGDFLVQVKHDYSFDPKDIGFDGFDVSPLWGWLRLPDIKLGSVETGQGGVLQQIIPKAVNIDERAYGAGVSAADKSAGLGQQLLAYQKRMLQKWKKLGKKQQEAVDKYIRDANDQELPFNTSAIKARGIDDAGVDVLVDWKTVQDTQWALENTDVNRTLRNRGFEVFEHRPSDTKLIVEPTSRNASDNVTRYYDPATGRTKTLTNKELDELYEQGGTTAKLRKAEEFDGEQVENIIVGNNPNSGYNRRIRDDDRTLAYRDGYYHVRYTDPYYVTRFDPKTKARKTIARAQSRREAELEAARLSDTNDGFEYDWKADSKTSVDESFDNNLDVQFSAGRSTQRLRGKRLERVGTDKTIGDMGLESPIDSLTRSIASVSNRTSFRQVLEADKRRWMSQFKDLLPKDKMHFPSDINDIRGGKGSNEARNAYRYISGLQDGYVNMIDEGSKRFFAAASDVAGEKGWQWVDKLARKAAQASPSSAARLTAFRLFLASNPHGQFILQFAPAIPVISSLNPLGWGRVVQQMGILGAFHRGVDLSTSMKVGKFSGVKPEDMREILKDYELSGMSAAVNAHSYISEQMGRLADRNIAQKAMSVAGKPLQISQAVGFDFGEQTLMSLIWLSERDVLTRKLGRNKLTAAERENLSVRVRALTGDMNRGGEMPYNSNTLSVIMQFLQSPHKISSGLILGHKALSKTDRIKLATGYTVAFGVPGIPIINTMVDKLMPPEQTELKEVVKGGLSNLVLNRMLSSMTGTDVGIDFAGRLQPFSITPMIEFAQGILSTSIPEMITGSAAPSLIADGGRVGEFIKAVAAPFVPGQYESVDEYKQIGLTFMQMFTGLSNTMKAQYMMELGKITTRTGQVVDDDISFMEVLAKAAGFATLDEARYWESNKIEWEVSDKIDEDIKEIVDKLFMVYTRQGEDVADIEIQMRVLSEASRVFGNNPNYMDKVADYYAFKAGQNPDVLFEKLFKGSGLYDPDDAIRMINASNMSQEQVDVLLEMYDIAGESYGN